MKTMHFFAVAVALCLSAWAVAENVAMPRERFLDKCKGAWTGQMIGVCYGDVYEFRSNAKAITDPLKPWSPERIKGAIGQDDCYVEMTFLKAIEDYGLDVTFEQAGKAFADSKYELWHANKFGRENVRHGIMPPKSGHPDYNRHADDIDFQIESDLFGILCPGMPQESNRLCDIFGHVMNYGDGVYGGMFFAGMYAAAYFEDNDINKVIAEGLACIPAESLYHKCISDVIQWHKENPNDWLAVWNKIEEKWQDDVDCQPKDAVNIDAKLNGAYVVMGMLYGEGDLLKTVEFATRCGQDTDCNASSAAGVLCCMRGFKALDEQWVKGIKEIENTEFSYTDYSFNTLIPACQKVTEAIILRLGGEVKEDAYMIPRQAPVAAKLEQWDNQTAALSVPILPGEFVRWSKDWKLVACGHDMEPGVESKKYDRANVLCLHPVNEEKPAVIEANLAVPKDGKPKLVIETTSDQRGDYLLKVLVDKKPALEKVIDGHGKWTTVEVDLSAFAGKTVPVQIQNCANGWYFEAAYFAKVAIE